MALLSMRADRFWKKIGKKISIQGLDVVGFDKSKVECFNYHKMGHFARECRAPRSQDRGRRDNYKQGSKVEEQAPKALMAIDGVRWDWSYMANDEENHALELETLKKVKEGLDGKLAGFLTASKDLDNLIESQRSDKNKDGLGYSAVPPPPAQIYSSPKKDLSWTGLSSLLMIRTITPKPFIKFVKPSDSPSKGKTDKVETSKKPLVKYAEEYIKPNKKPNKKGEKGTSRFHDNTHKRFTRRPVVHRPYRPHVIPMRSTMNDARPNMTSFNKQEAREFSNARTPQQNGVTERRNRTLIEAARTMLANAILPVTFWAEAVNTACYV
nr:ribonuclease H-like domain-containing protein [Tanacetum cinerariifolium]